MTASDAHAGQVARAPKYKLLGLLFVVVPLAVFAAFAIGEGIEREPGWWGHLLQSGDEGAVASLPGLAIVALPLLVAGAFFTIAGRVSPSGSRASR